VGSERGGGGGGSERDGEGEIALEGGTDEGMVRERVLQVLCVRWWIRGVALNCSRRHRADLTVPPPHALSMMRAAGILARRRSRRCRLRSASAPGCRSCACRPPSRRCGAAHGRPSGPWQAGRPMAGRAVHGRPCGAAHGRPGGPWQAVRPMAGCVGAHGRPYAGMRQGRRSKCCRPIPTGRSCKACEPRKAALPALCMPCEHAHLSAHCACLRVGVCMWVVVRAWVHVGACECERACVCSCFCPAVGVAGTFLRRRSRLCPPRSASAQSWGVCACRQPPRHRVTPPRGRLLCHVARRRVDGTPIDALPSDPDWPDLTLLCASAATNSAAAVGSDHVCRDVVCDVCV
jgi:hypothetical protein